MSLNQYPALSRSFGESPDERLQEQAYYRDIQHAHDTIARAKKYAQEGDRNKGRELIANEFGGGDYEKGRREMARFQHAEKAIAELNKKRSQLEKVRFSGDPDIAARQKERRDVNLAKIEQIRHEVMMRTLQQQ